MSATLFFDIDQTLVSNHGIPKIFRKLAADLAKNASIGAEVLLQSIWDENRHRQQSDPDNPLTMDWDDITKTIAQQHGLTLSQSLDALWKSEISADDIEVLDDAPELLKKLKAEGYLLVIATKGLSKYQIPVLEHTRLLAYFDDMLTPDNTGYLKTSAGFYQKYHDSGGLRVQIGDRYLDDVIGPHRVGIKTILRAPIDALQPYPPQERPQHLEPHLNDIAGFPQEGSTIRPDAIVLSLQEIPPILHRF